MVKKFPALTLMNWATGTSQGPEKAETTFTVHRNAPPKCPSQASSYSLSPFAFDTSKNSFVPSVMDRGPLLPPLPDASKCDLTLEYDSMTVQNVCYSFASLEHIHHLITPHMFRLKLQTLHMNVHEQTTLVHLQTHLLFVALNTSKYCPRPPLAFDWKEPRCIFPSPKSPADSGND